MTVIATGATTGTTLGISSAAGPPSARPPWKMRRRPRRPSRQPLDLGGAGVLTMGSRTRASSCSSRRSKPSICIRNACYKWTTHKYLKPQGRLGGTSDSGGSGSLSSSRIGVDVVDVLQHPEPQRTWPEHPNRQSRQRHQRRARRHYVEGSARFHVCQGNARSLASIFSFAQLLQSCRDSYLVCASRVADM